MNRMDEYREMLKDMEEAVPGLEMTLNRAYKRKHRRNVQWALRPAIALAGCLTAFVLLVNFSAPIAYACSRVPVLKDLAAAVTFSKSLTDAVENAYVQQMKHKQTKNEITAEVAYLIVDQKQVNVFYRMDSGRYPQLQADPQVLNADGERPESCAYSAGDLGVENGELHCLSIDFLDGNVPDSLIIKLEVYSNAAVQENMPAAPSEELFPDITDAKIQYLANFEFLLEFDPRFTAAGKIIPVNQTVILDTQSITVSSVEIYPTHMRVEITEAEENTAWLEDLEFYIETDWGMRFEPVSNGITATGSGESPAMVSYRADSSYFYQADKLKLVITGAKWLQKDMQTVYLNLLTGETGGLPEGAEFVCAKKYGNDWVVKFQADWNEAQPMYQLFRNSYHDAEGNSYEINQWSNYYGEAGEDGTITSFYEEFPLRDYPEDEVWLKPVYSYRWTAEDQIVIPIQ